MNHAQRMRRILLTAALCAFAVAPANAQAQDDVLGRAMRDELARSKEKLRLAQLERPYFVAYRVHEAQGLHVSASCGSLLGSSESHARTLSVELRVGDYAFDNTNFFAASGFWIGFSRSWFGLGQLPLDDNYIEIRRQIWLATDAAYKQALEDLAGKRAALKNKTRTENLADFSEEDPTQTTDENPAVQLKRSDAEALVRDLSKLLSEMPNIYASTVSFGVSNGRTRYVNSEGSSYTDSRPLIALTANASTQATDGMPLGDSVEFYAMSFDSFPARDQLATQIQGMGVRLESLRKAPLLGRYNGPVLFEGRAAAELFSKEFAPALVAQRKPVSGNPEMEAVFERFSQQGESPFADKIGARVLPDFLSVVDNPTILQYGKNRLLGSYKVDDDGVRARETHLVENGILKTFLTTRTPVEGATHSTGNRRGAGAAPSNLFVEVRKGPSESELREQLVALVKKRGLEYGIVVRKIGGEPGATMEEQAMAVFKAMTGQAAGGKSILVAYKIYLDGREEFIRGAHLSGIRAESFKEIVAASKAATVYNTIQLPLRSSAMISSLAEEGMSMPIVSYVVPSLLFDDLTLTKPSGEMPKPPFSKPPVSAQ